MGIPFPARTPEYAKEWKRRRPHLVKLSQEKHKEAKRHSSRKYRYGITKEQYEERLLNQKNCCAICLSTEVGRKHTAFHVDHNHYTGKIRGLLCDKCNRGLGYFNDDPDVLQKAVEYLIENN